MPKKTTVNFTDDELNQIAELLRISQQSLIIESDELAARFGASSFVEYLRKWAEYSADLRAKVESR